MEKINRKILPSLEVDVFVCCETQVDWRLVHADRHFTKVIRPEVTVKGIAANNQTSRIVWKGQVGGTAVVALGRLGDLVTEVGKDSTGLGRWCYLKLQGHHNWKVTLVMCAYYPRKSSVSALIILPESR